MTKEQLRKQSNKRKEKLEQIKMLVKFYYDDATYYDENVFIKIKKVLEVD